MSLHASITRFAFLLICGSVCSGCASSSWSVPLVRLARPTDGNSMTVVSDAPPTEARQPILSAAESAELCLTAAREMEAHDRDRAAIEQYERARLFQPKQTGVARHLAVLYQREGDYDRAEKEFSTAVREEPLEADVWNDLASFRFQRGEYADSAEAAREAIELAPEHKRAWVNLGLALAEQDKFEEAHKAFTKATGAATAHQNLGIILARKGRDDDARRELAEARRLDPTLRAPQPIVDHLARAESTSPGHRK